MKIEKLCFVIEMNFEIKVSSSCKYTFIRQKYVQSHNSDLYVCCFFFSLSYLIHNYVYAYNSYQCNKF